MTLMAWYRSIRVRLGLLIVLAMAALVGYLIYDGVGEHAAERERAHENLKRLATFAATAERTQFDATENFLNIVKQAESLRNAAAAPDDPAAYEACTRGLYISDQLVPGTRFSLWDTNGSILCSSRGAARGQFIASGRLWFEQAKRLQGFATGDFELIDNIGAPSLTFGIPMTDPVTNQVVAYVSGAVEIQRGQLLPIGESLPPSGRLTLVDQDGTVINSTGREPGERLSLFPKSFATLGSYLDSAVESESGRTGAAVRITDADDALASVIVSAETDELVTPLTEKLFDVLLPVGVLTLVTLIAVWLLGQRWVVRPIETLGAASDALASGELNARADVRSGVSELDRLATKFNEMAETRERASQAKDEFLGLVSHELKTPITMTLGNAEILRNRGNQLDAETRQTALADIHESTLRLAAIVDNLLVLARLERGAALENEPLALLTLAQIAVEQQLRRSPGRHVTVTGDARLLALGGETYVGQVLQNMLGNALKYSARAAAVEVVIEETHDSAVVRVLDRGAGIDDTEIEAIFTPFYRSARTADVAEGIGIGLSVCKRLVEAMGGTIWAIARPGGGTEFGFSLPLARDDTPAAAAGEAVAAPAT